ncbi:hypothetical protein [Leuconostoc mesenteroides]|nr:hypothetical protein [Leuconostoc mesenteroides]
MVLAHYKTRLSLAKLRDLAKTDCSYTENPDCFISRA